MNEKLISFETCHGRATERDHCSARNRCFKFDTKESDTSEDEPLNN